MRGGLGPGRGGRRKTSAGAGSRATSSTRRGIPIEGAKVVVQSLTSRTRFDAAERCEGPFRRRGDGLGGVEHRRDAGRLRPGDRSRSTSPSSSPTPRRPSPSRSWPAWRPSRRTRVLRVCSTRATQFYAEGRHDEAIAVFEEILAKYPEIYQVHLNLGSNYLKKGDLDKAQSEFRLVLDKTLQVQGSYEKDPTPRFAGFRAWARSPSSGTISRPPRSTSSKLSRSPPWTRPRPTTSARSSSPTRRSTRRSPISSWRSRSRRTGRSLTTGWASST